MAGNVVLEKICTEHLNQVLIVESVNPERAALPDKSYNTRSNKFIEAHVTYLPHVKNNQADLVPRLQCRLLTTLLRCINGWLHAPAVRVSCIGA